MGGERRGESGAEEDRGSAVPEAIPKDVVVEPSLRGTGRQGLPKYEPAELSEAKRRAKSLSPLRPYDMEHYTIRINTWRRDEQLLASLDHHSECEGASRIEVIWCDADNDPPPEIARHASGKVVVERHAVNSLNERFRVQATEDPGGDGGGVVPTATLGVLSMDDDVLRPCKAIDAGFFRWVDHPDRIVGFDARLHLPPASSDAGNGRYKYGYMSSTEKQNRYSLTLPRYCFLHRDYLDLYVSLLPRPVYDRVSEKFNCEDIAMSLFVSALTDGKPPLLADYWAVKSLIKLHVPSGISNTKNHKGDRDNCVHDFLTVLGLRGENMLDTHELWHRQNLEFGYGSDPDPDPFAKPPEDAPDRRWELAEMVGGWRGLDGRAVMKREVWEMMVVARAGAQKRGLIAKTREWEDRFGGGDNGGGAERQGKKKKR